METFGSSFNCARAVVRKLLVLHHFVRMIRIFFCKLKEKRKLKLVLYEAFFIIYEWRIRTVLLLRCDWGPRRWGGRRSIVDWWLWLMGMRRVDARGWHMEQCRRCCCWLMMMNVTTWVESIAITALEYTWWWCWWWHTSSRNSGACRTAWDCAACHRDCWNSLSYIDNNN